MAGIERRGGFQLAANISDSGSVGRIVSIKKAASVAAYSGDPVAISGGFVSPLADDAIANIAGVAVGFFWIDPTTGEPVESQFVSSTQTSGAGEYNGLTFTAGDRVGVKVIVDPNAIYAVKASEAIAETSRGAGASISGAGTGTATKINGFSNATVTVTGVTPGTDDAVVIVDVYESVGTPTFGDSGGVSTNTWGTAETIVLVKFRDTVWT